MIEKIGAIALANIIDLSIAILLTKWIGKIGQKALSSDSVIYFINDLGSARALLFDL